MRFKPVMLSLISLLLVTFLLTGCWNNQAWGIRGDEFQKTFIRYSSAVRWAEYDQAYTYIKMRNGEPEVLDLDGLTEFEVTRYEIVSKTLGPKTETKPADVLLLVEIDFLQEGSPRIKTMKREETWWFDEEAEKWYLDGNLPDFAQQH